MNSLTLQRRKGVNDTPSQNSHNSIDSSIALTVFPFQLLGTLTHGKKRLQTHLIYERLDRAIARNDWITLYPDSIIRHGTFSCSDHCPTMLSAFNPIRRQKNLPFQFQNYWCQYRQLDPIVGKQWQSHDRGTKMFKLAQKLKRTKHHIKNWREVSWETIIRN